MSVAVAGSPFAVARVAAPRPRKRSKTGVRRIRTEVVPYSRLNILTQVRAEMDSEETRALANSLVTIGMLQLPAAGEMTLAELKRYLPQHNALWGTNYRASDLVRDFVTGMYLVALFGHRRTEAHAYIWNHGCDACVDEYGAEAPGTCWARHPETLHPDGMEIRIIHGLEWIDAMYAQLAENTYVPVPRDREAVVWRKLWDYERSRNQRFTIKQFAAKVGRSPAIVSEALRFCDLPDEVRQAVAGNHIPWGIAVELLRLQAAGFEPNVIVYRKNYAIVERPTVQHFHRIVSGMLAERTMATMELFELDVETIRRNELAGGLERRALTTLLAEQRDLLGQLAALVDGQSPDLAAALRSSAVRTALGRVDEIQIKLKLV